MTKNYIDCTTLIVWDRCGHYRIKQPDDVFTSVDANCPSCGHWRQTRHSILPTNNLVKRRYARK